jgi:DNA (cytosine-5)-methyltransferase 1
MFGVERGIKIQFPEPTHYYEGSTIGYRDRSRVISIRHGDLFEPAPVLVPAVTVMDAIGDLPPVESGDEATKYIQAPSNDFQAERRRGAKHLSMHVSTAHSKKMLEIIRHSGKNIDCIPKHLITSGFSSCYSRLAGDEPSVTLTVNFVHPASNRCIHPEQHRALTAREGARIQSYDDTFKFAGNRTQVVKQIGNAVPPLLGRAIAKSVAAMLS